MSYDEAQAACEAMHPDLTLAEFELPGEMAAVMGSKYLMLVLRTDLTDTARIAFMFNGGQSPGSILSPICTKNGIGHLHYKG